jgi:hypothetical protein
MQSARNLLKVTPIRWDAESTNRVYKPTHRPGDDTRLCHKGSGDERKSPLSKLFPQLKNAVSQESSQGHPNYTGYRVPEPTHRRGDNTRLCYHGSGAELKSPLSKLFPQLKNAVSQESSQGHPNYTGYRVPEPTHRRYCQR